MKYKAFQDWYHEAKIRHLLLYVHGDSLISPPFATEQCKSYSRVLVWNGSVSYIDLELPPATSKTNAVIEVDGDLWFIPYGIYDNFNVVVQLKDFKPIYHYIDKPGRGQFYSAASSGHSGFSFPLGYEDTSYGIYITEGSVYTIDFDKGTNTKLHMGCVYSHGKFWSMPRSDELGYTDLVSYDGLSFEKYKVPNINNVTRKYTDLIAVDNKLYALPFGETSGLNDVVEFDINTKQFTLHPIGGPDFAKKYNTFVQVNRKIIGLPYGDEHSSDSSLGIVFDVDSKQSLQFDIGMSWGGKYRYRTGISYHGYGFFFPAGTPSCPILKIDQQGNVCGRLQLNNTMVGRPVIYDDQIYVMCYNVEDETQSILAFDKDLNYKVKVTV